MISKNKFMALLQDNKCPFCEEDLKHYDGALGYEAYKCECGVTLDHSGLHFE